MNLRSLDLGCGSNLRGPEGWERWGLDLVARSDSRIAVADLTFDSVPFPDCHFARVYAYDFLEHLPMRAYAIDQNGRGRTINTMINVFNEVWRVLVPGGVFETFTPHVPHWQEVFRDPTHVSVWTEQTWEYLVASGSMVPLTREYGLTANFRLLRKLWRGAHLQVELEKV